LEGLGPYRLARLYEALHKFSFYEVLELPWAVGEYAPELREDWEKEPGQRWREQAE
jgi:hypothetical protein